MGPEGAGTASASAPEPSGQVQDSPMPEAPLAPFPCPNCGAEVVDAEREGDWVCGECGEIHLDARPRAPQPKA